MAQKFRLGNSSKAAARDIYERKKKNCNRKVEVELSVKDNVFEDTPEHMNVQESIHVRKVYVPKSENTL